MDFWNDKDERYKFKMVEVYHITNFMKLIQDYRQITN